MREEHTEGEIKNNSPMAKSRILHSETHSLFQNSLCLVENVIVLLAMNLKM